MSGVGRADNICYHFYGFFQTFVGICGKFRASCGLRFCGDTTKLISLLRYVIKLTADSLCDTNSYYWVWINRDL